MLVTSLHGQLPATLTSYQLHRDQLQQITMSKVGIYKPKVYTIVVTSVEPTNIHEAMVDLAWQLAVHDELPVLSKNNTWALAVPPSDQVLVGCKWIFKVKKNPDGSVACNKARLMAHGFSQAAGLDYHKTFSAVVKANTELLHARMKHMELDLHFVRDKALSGNLQVNYIPGRDHVADILTKPLTIGILLNVVTNSMWFHSLFFVLL
ncbi:hypothetical protein CXB51_000535 [Gossypium anomalum]|uniref:Reverse transcriptase Ty1/copia-type domain-containing protein n=1 Tax=Gossypium anomalum TaxID=47600 RepID=A0A8J5ZKP5_9ROSI|nr:hypothetical protein CXB51_000535 [Gossypium anomalum]